MRMILKAGLTINHGKLRDKFTPLPRPKHYQAEPWKTKQFNDEADGGHDEFATDGRSFVVKSQTSKEASMRFASIQV